jgi:hypothetical protein
MNDNSSRTSLQKASATAVGLDTGFLRTGVNPQTKASPEERKQTTGKGLRADGKLFRSIVALSLL